MVTYKNFIVGIVFHIKTITVITLIKVILFRLIYSKPLGGKASIAISLKNNIKIN
jgi:hypothetical protein